MMTSKGKRSCMKDVKLWDDNDTGQKVKPIEVAIFLKTTPNRLAYRLHQSNPSLSPHDASISEESKTNFKPITSQSKK